MRFSDLNEDIKTAVTRADKLKYADEVWDLLQTSYANIPGGFGTASSIEELINKSHIWKMRFKAGKMQAVNIYKDSHGRKSIASGALRTEMGKASYETLKREDIKMKRAWGEVSGGAEKMMSRLASSNSMNFAPLDNEFAGFLTNKEILAKNSDGKHYTRLINGVPHEKIIYGFVDLTVDDTKALKAMGIKIEDLPPEVKIG